MKRAVIALVLALAALALLISLALESRPLPVETHVAQYTIKNDLKRIDDDFRSLVDTLQSAWQEQQPPGEGARALLARITAAPEQLPTSSVRHARQQRTGSPSRQQPRDIRGQRELGGSAWRTS